MTELDMAVSWSVYLGAEVDDAVTTASQSASHSQITALEATQMPSTGEVDKLRKPVDDVERDKRDLVGVPARSSVGLAYGHCILWINNSKYWHNRDILPNDDQDRASNSFFWNILTRLQYLQWYL
jgi:hypothetical protein